MTAISMPNNNEFVFAVKTLSLKIFHLSRIVIIAVEILTEYKPASKPRPLDVAALDDKSLASHPRGGNSVPNLI